MYEIRIHGRGGQGSVTAALLIAKAAFFDKKISQAFPNFGVERSGAPVEAYARIAKTPIRTRSQIYHPNFVIIQDATLLSAVNVFAGINEESIVIVNSNQKIEELPHLPQNTTIYLVPATETALKILGKPIVNTLLLGYFAGITGLISLDSVKKAVSEKFDGEVLSKNLEAVETAFQAAEHLNSQKIPGKLETNTGINQMKPKDGLTEIIAKPGSTMQNLTGSWRTFKPMYDHEICINCGKCDLTCPDGCILEITTEMNSKGRHFREVDLDYCKGCGICAEGCPVKAITMVLEEK